LKEFDMKTIGLVTAVLAGAALVAAPSAEAAPRKGKKAPVQRVIHAAPQSTAVFAGDGTLVGMDPDPFIRLMIMRDPKPWEHSGH
jgi:hypothetical protein